MFVHEFVNKARQHTRSFSSRSICILGKRTSAGAAWETRNIRMMVLLIRKRPHNCNISSPKHGIIGYVKVGEGALGENNSDDHVQLPVRPLAGSTWGSQVRNLILVSFVLPTPILEVIHHIRWRFVSRLNVYVALSILLKSARTPTAVSI